ncbi:MAG: acetyl-CoA decarbonylase/synthase complex subunit gamma [Candidatus Syntropharchaeia archaeon]
MAEKKVELVRSPMEVVKHLPGDDCEECGFETCYEFALSLIDRTVTFDDCPRLSKAGRIALEKMFAPPMNYMTFGSGDKVIKTGGEVVMYRDMLTYFGKTVLAYDVWDTMENFEERVKKINDLEIERFGDIFKVDAIAVKCTSGDPNKFEEAVSKASKITDLPLILCSFDPAVLEAGAKVLKEKKPLLYAATEDNWKEVFRIASEYKTAVAVYSTNPSTLGSIAKVFFENGVKDIILDPGTFCNTGGLLETINNITMLRRAAVEDVVEEVCFPTMTVPMAFRACFENDEEAEQYETAFGIMSITKGINLMILHYPEPEEFLTLTYHREGIFSHPKVAKVVKPGIYEFNNPDSTSPLLATTNYSLTYGTVAGDLDRMKVKAWLLVVDTGGESVDTAVGGVENSFSAEKILETIEESGVEEKIDHRIIILPGFCRDIITEYIDAMEDWKIVLGPPDSREIDGFLTENWENLLKEYGSS